jgi:hypothetical protein
MLTAKLHLGFRKLHCSFYLSIVSKYALYRAVLCGARNSIKLCGGLGEQHVIVLDCLYKQWVDWRYFYYDT